MMTTNSPRLLVFAWLVWQLLSGCSSSSPRDQNWDSSIGRDDGAMATGGADAGDQDAADQNDQSGPGGASAAGGQAGDSAGVGGAAGTSGSGGAAGSSSVGGGGSAP